MIKRTFDLEDRLIEFSVKALSIIDDIPNTKIGNHLGGQLMRSATSPALNYGEAQAAESPADFIHKMKICLKELRESQICMKVIARKGILSLTLINPVLQECGELIAIFTKSFETAKKNNSRKKR